MKNEQISVTATINADKQTSWNHYTNPDHIVKWNFADPSWHCPAATNDMQVGGKYFARMEAKDGSFGFDFEAEYKEITNGEQFSYTMNDGRNATVTFKSIDDKTNVLITFDAENENPIEFQRQGWQAILDNFKNYTENKI